MGGSRNQGRHQEVLQVQAEGKDYLDRAERMAAANCLLVYVAFFDALRHEWPSIVRELGLSEEEGKARLTALPDQGRAPSFRDLFLADFTIVVPRPTDDEPHRDKRGIFRELAIHVDRALRADPAAATNLAGAQLRPCDLRGHTGPSGAPRSACQ